MKAAILLFAISISTNLISCNDKKDAVETASANELLLKCWTDSYEESSVADQKVFRPCDYKEFPASHYRLRFDLMPNNVGSYLFLSPTDGHFMAPSTWTYDEHSKALFIKDSTGVIAHSYQVIELASNKLVVTGD